MYGNSKNFRCVNCRFFFFIGPPMRAYDLRSHSSEQVQRNGVLELELQDVAQLDKPKGGTATLRADCKHDKAVTSASWDPRGRSVVSTCYDDALRCMFCMIACVRVPRSYTAILIVWDVSPSFMTNDAPFPHFRPLSRIRHNCQTVSSPRSVLLASVNFLR